MITQRELQLVADMADRWHDRFQGGQSCTAEMTAALRAVQAELRHWPHGAPERRPGHKRGEG